ncbi:MAG: D-Ala-D-Ala carboxypeptidase family metallohydrolase [Luteolibacter sp.]
MIFTQDNTPTNEETGSIMSRRSLLSGLGMAGLGWLGSSAIGSAFSLTPKVTILTSRSNSATQQSAQTQSGLAMPDLPEEWLAMHGKSAKEYLQYLNSLKLKRVDPAQVLESHAKEKGGVWNTIPPKSSWRRMGYTLRVAERIAQEMNESEVEIISAYRSPGYNARCRGARTHSWHQQNIAVDVKFSARPSKVTAMARQLRDEGLFRGGVGGYWNFTHIDARGQNINW